MVKKTGGAAFPVAGSEHNYPTEGATLRDYFAAKAMQGDWVAQNEYIGAFSNGVSEETLYERAQVYYRMADAMLLARGE